MGVAHKALRLKKAMKALNKALNSEAPYRRLDDTIFVTFEEKIKAEEESLKTIYRLALLNELESRNNKFRDTIGTIITLREKIKNWKADENKQFRDELIMKKDEELLKTKEAEQRRLKAEIEDLEKTYNDYDSTFINDVHNNISNEGQKLDKLISDHEEFKNKVISALAQLDMDDPPDRRRKQKRVDSYNTQLRQSEERFEEEKGRIDIIITELKTKLSAKKEIKNKLEEKKAQERSLESEYERNKGAAGRAVLEKESKLVEERELAHAEMGRSLEALELELESMFPFVNAISTKAYKEYMDRHKGINKLYEIKVKARPHWEFPRVDLKLRANFAVELENYLCGVYKEWREMKEKQITRIKSENSGYLAKDEKN